MKKKREIVLLQKVVSVEEFTEMVQKNIYPLCIVLKPNEIEKYRKVREKKNDALPDFKLISEFYLQSIQDKYLYFSSYILRDKIEQGEVVINKMIDEESRIKHIRIVTSYDGSKIVFKRTPKLFFKSWYSSTNSEESTENLSYLCINTLNEYQKKLIKDNN